jgi:Fur family ferric uptake transcriptional regulator
MHAMQLPPTPQHDEEILPPLCAVFRRHLRAEGQKYTPERAHILDTIINIDGLFEADTLLESVRGDGFTVSKATVYRTLKLLEDAGIIQRVPFEREQVHYQLVYGRRANTLIVDLDTGEVEAFEVPELVTLRDRVCRERGLTAEGHRLQIFVRSGKSGLRTDAGAGRPTIS